MAFDIQEELKKLPGKPGVYLMHDADDTIIYVGKAISLKNRVRQYFQTSRNKGPKIERMVTHIARFEYIVTDSELEALVLELEDCVPAAPSAEEETEARELSRTIDRWLDGLPREDRVLFVRRYWYGQRLDELSGQLGWPPNRVSQRLLRLRTGLKRYLEREGVVL